MKRFYAVFSIILFLAFNNFSQVKNVEPKSVPEIAVITYKLLDMPGINNEKSKLEISCELRIITEKEYYEAAKNGKLKQMNDNEKIGVSIGKGSYIGKDFLKEKNRQVIFNFPIDKETQERLRNQPTNRVNLGEVELTDEVIKKSREDETKAQVFLAYTNALVYDAKLKKTTIVPLSRIFFFPRYPDAVFGMGFKVTEDGYDIKSILPKKDSPNSVLKTVTTKH